MEMYKMKELKSVKQIEFDEVESSLNNGFQVLAMNGLTSFWTCFSIVKQLFPQNYKK